MITTLARRLQPVLRAVDAAAAFGGCTAWRLVQLTIFFRARQELLKLDDQMLKDIGIQRAEIEHGEPAALARPCGRTRLQS